MCRPYGIFLVKRFKSIFFLLALRQTSVYKRISNGNYFLNYFSNNIMHPCEFKNCTLLLQNSFTNKIFKRGIYI